MSDQQRASGTSDDYEGIELEATAQAKNYTRWILDSIREYLGPVIVEVGAGRGTFTAELLGAGDGRVVAIEPSVHLFPLLKEALGGHPRADLRHGTLAQHAPALEGNADSVVYINVIEHIAEHHAELEQAYRVLAPGGRICVFVPALPWLFAPFDASIGHHRRYRRHELEELARSVGFEVLSARYFDRLGVLTWLIAFKLLRMDMARGSVRFYDRVAVPVARALDVVLPVPLGKSLLLVGRKPN